MIIFIVKILKFIFRILFFLIVAGIVFIAYRKYEAKPINFNSLSEAYTDVANSWGVTVDQAEQKAPDSNGPEERKFTWEYDNKNYTINETLHTSTYEFYRDGVKNFSYSGALPNDWEDKYVGIFLQEKDEEDVFQKIATDIYAAGKKNNLSDDRIVELVLAFVQAIQYDSAKASAITKGDKSQAMNYPYETLYTQKGVCADKSFLATMILRKLGYGTALFVYDGENHMALGVQCPMQYSDYNSGYCYAETTSVGIKIGVIPSLSSNNNQANTLKKLGYINYNQTDEFDEKKLGEVKIYQKSQGKEYRGIAATIQISKKIENLGSKLNDIKKQISQMRDADDDEEKSLDEFLDKMNKLKKNNEIEEYNSLVATYNRELKNLQNDIDKYNAKIKEYNATVKSYNSLIENF